MPHRRQSVSIRNYKVGDWSDRITAGRAYALHTSDLGSVSSTPYGSSGTTGVNPEHIWGAHTKDENDNN